MNKHERVLTEILVLLIVMFLLVPIGCKKREAGQAKDDSAVTSEADKPKVALIMKSLANEFFKTMEEGALAHLKEHAEDYDLIVVGIKDEQDVAKQIDYVELMMAQQVDAIVIAPADSKALVPVCKRAMDAGIIVVNIDNKFDEGVLAARGVKIPFVGPDNRKGARLAGEYLAAKLKPGDNVAIIEGIPNAFNGIQRKLGFEDAMKAGGMNIVSSQSGYWEMARAEPIVSALVTEHADLKAVLCANDNMALGAVSAIKTAGKTEDILVVGFDNISAVQRLLKEGKILCTIDQHGDKLAIYGIEYALEMLEGQGTPSDKETPVDLITAQTLP